MRWLIVEAVNRLKARSCLIDGEAVACDDNGVAVFAQLRRKPSGRHVFLFAFDLLETRRRGPTAGAIRDAQGDSRQPPTQGQPGVRLNEHIAHPNGAAVFHHACKLGAEGIVSKRLGSRYRSGRSPDWLKLKNPEAPAVRREAEEDWGR